MTLRQYLSVMFLATVFCWISFCVVLINVDPYQSGNAGFTFFYVSSFLTLLGTINLVSFYFLKLFLMKDMPMYKLVKKSFNAGLFLSIILTLLLYLQANKFLHFWNFTIFLLIIIFSVSFIFATKKAHDNM